MVINQGPKTRAQLKRQSEANNGKHKNSVKPISTQKDKDQDKQKETTGWNKIKDVEAKLVALQKQYDRASDNTTKSKVRKLIDKYEKQVKALIIDNNKKKKEKENKNSTHEIPDEVGTTSSDNTVKTTNSTTCNHINNDKDKEKAKNKNLNRVTPAELNRQSATSKNNNTESTKLQPLGKTRSSTPQGKKKVTITHTPVEKINEETNEAVKVTQEDDKTIMSDLTNITKESTKYQKEKNGSTHEDKQKKVTNTVSFNEEATVISKCTKIDNGRKHAGSNTNNEKKNYCDNKTDNEKANETRNDTTLNDDQNTVISECTVYGKKEEEKNDSEQLENEEINKKQKTPVENPYTKENKKNHHESYADATKNNKGATKTKVSTEKNENNVSTNKSFARIRFSFTAQQFQGSKNMHMKQIIYDTMQCAKLIDKHACLLPWIIDDGNPALNGDEVRLMPDSSIDTYSNMPKTNDDYRNGKVYYGNGIRIGTVETVEAFVDKWNFTKYEETKGTPFANWKPIRPAETQTYSKAHPIGYMAGSTERGFYNTIKKHLEKEFDGNVEASFQPVYQAGVSQRVWDLANKKADEQYMNRSSKEHKKIKFSLAPSALVIYTWDETQVISLRTKFINKYGKLCNGSWPEMVDGSRMRFIPIIKGFIEEEEKREKLYTHLSHQASAKAGEVKMNLKFKDITTPKPYLNGDTLEKVIHRITTKEDKDIPIFKHIATRWSTKKQCMEYEIVVALSLAQEAAATLKKLKNDLIKQYGSGIRNHFTDAMNYETRTWSVMPSKRKRNTVESNWDDDVGNFLDEINTADKLSKVLIEGMEQLQHHEQNDQARKDPCQNEPNKKNESNKNQQNEQKGEQNEEDKEEMQSENKENEIISINSESSASSNSKSKDTLTETSDTDSYIQHSAWDEISVVGEFENCVPASQDEKRKVFNTLEKHCIYLVDIEKWKNKEWVMLGQIVEECKKKEYSVMKRIVTAIVEERKSEQRSNNEEKGHVGTSHPPDQNKKSPTTGEIVVGPVA